MNTSHILKHKLYLLRLLFTIFILLMLVIPGKVLAAPYDITEYSIPTQNSVSSWLNFGPDENIWFVQRQFDNLAKVDSSTGSITEYNVQDIGSDCAGLTSGPDGNLWFIRGNTNNISKRDMNSGVITDYPVENESGCLGGIISGPDGNLWFGGESSFIAKMTVLGQVTKYSIPDQGVGFQLKNGADGNIWFADTNQNRIGKLSTTGEFTFYSPFSGTITDLTWGTDGNIWYVGINNDGLYVAKMTSQGSHLASYVVASEENVFSYSITFGRDNKAWVAILGTDQLASIDSTGNINYYSSPSPGEGPFLLASKPNTDLWYSSISGNTISRVEIPEIEETNNNSQPLTGTTSNSTPISLVLPGSATNASLIPIASNTIPTDPSFTYPSGLTSFQFDTEQGATETITLYFDLPGDPQDYTARKYNTTTKAFTTIQGATITRATYNNQSMLKLTYQITDGGILDQDNTTNGTIVDPVGLAQQTTGGPDTGLPRYWLLGVKQ